MKTNNVTKNILILLIVSISIFTIYSFTTIEMNSDSLSYDQDLYENLEISEGISYTKTALNTDKCGDGKEDEEAKDKETGEESKETEVKDSLNLKEGKCGDDKKDDKKEDKKKDEKDDEEKDSKCGDGKCGQ